MNAKLKMQYRLQRIQQRRHLRLHARLLSVKCDRTIDSQRLQDFCRRPKGSRKCLIRSQCLLVEARGKLEHGNSKEW